MIITLALPVIERIANYALQQDKNAVEKLLRIDNQIIEINCTDWQIQFFIVISQSKLHFEKTQPGKPDTTLKSTLSNFLQLLSKGADTVSLFQHPVDVSGNTKNIEILRDVFKQLQIDWEEELSKVFGDTLAHKLCFYAKQADTSRKVTQEKLATNLQEYLHYEARLLPTRTEIETFYDDVSKLRNDVDRLAAHIQSKEAKENNE